MSTLESFGVAPKWKGGMILQPVKFPEKNIHSSLSPINTGFREEWRQIRFKWG
jgi:hypothetical protein